MIDVRRLFLVAVVSVAPILAACSAPTGNDDDPTGDPPAGQDSTKRDQRPWG
jgi:hypothetical protein